MADLGRWLSGDYRVPRAPDPPADDGDPAEAATGHQERTPR
jgi:endogenous inhibitor of DNA gyrase (YacG/DUF329 family)